MKDDGVAFFMEVTQVVAGLAAFAATAIAALCYFDSPFLSFMR